MRARNSFIAGTLLCVAASAVAQSYPSRPLRFIVPAPPGGTADFLVRVTGPRLATALGWLSSACTKWASR